VTPIFPAIGARVLCTVSHGMRTTKFPATVIGHRACDIAPRIIAKADAPNLWGRGLEANIICLMHWAAVPA
jgi:hypothetical protein